VCFGVVNPKLKKEKSYRLDVASPEIFARNISTVSQLSVQVSLSLELTVFHTKYQLVKCTESNVRNLTTNLIQHYRAQCQPCRCSGLTTPYHSITS